MTEANMTSKKGLPQKSLPKKILFVAMQNSPHTCRWINSINLPNCERHLFAIDNNPPLPMLEGVTIHWPFIKKPGKQPSSLRGWFRFQLRNVWNLLTAQTRDEVLPNLTYEAIYPIPLLPLLQLLLHRISIRIGAAKTPVSLIHGPRTLAHLIRKLKPDLIHSMEFQHCGYTVLEAKQYCSDSFPTWLAANWGSDIYYYHQFADHRLQIERLLRNADYYLCECHRDVSLAQQLGMSAKALPVMPNTSGFDLEQAGRWRAATPTSQRQTLLIKGYQHFAGRVLTALEAVERCAEVVKDFQIVIFSASPEAIACADEMRLRTTIKNIVILPHTTHDAMLQAFAQARVYLGVSISDGISTSALEAMAMGAFPIQTNTACCDEWFEQAQGGYLVSPDNVEEISERLTMALSDDALVDRAAALNWETIKTRLDQRQFSQRLSNLYSEIFEAEPAYLPVPPPVPMRE